MNDKDKLRNVLVGVLVTFALSGIDMIAKQDVQTLYLTIPSKSYEYDIPSNEIHSASDYAKIIKDKLYGFGFVDKSWKIKYREKDIYWTKEMGQANFNAKYASIMRFVENSYRG